MNPLLNLIDTANKSNYNVITQIKESLMDAELIKIGNSQGIRIPKPILEQCGFKKTVNMEVRGHVLIIKSAKEPRKGWSESFKLMHKNKDDELLDKDIIESEFDDKEWTW